MASEVNIGEVKYSRFDTTGIFAKSILDVISKQNYQKLGYKYNSASNQNITEGNLLINTIKSNIKQAFDNKWYPTSQGGTFSNFLSWGTLP